MNSNNTVACPLDCYDCCEAVYDEKGNCKGSKEHKVTNGKLCVNFANLLNEEYLVEAFVDKKGVPLQTALSATVEKLKSSDPSKTLYYKGAGNLGVMQSAPKTFFANYGSVLTRGSLCDGAGAEGLEQGRGKVVNPPIENLVNADVIIVWGRNFSVTSPHMYNLVKDKTFITIDPIVTSIAKQSKLHLQLNPKTDHELALLLTRFAYMEDAEDENFIEEYAEGADWFFDTAKGRPIVSYQNTTGVSLKDVTTFFEIIKDKKVALMIGVGVQKYYEGAQITRTIDSFAGYIGIHNKEAGGVWYLDDSSYGYENKFPVTAKKRVDVAELDFASFDVVFIQGANPVVSAPNTQRVIDGLKNSFVIFYGTTLNETSQYADIIIPSSDFLTKKDVRLSYGHELKAISHAVKKAHANTISEYDFTQYMNEAFSFESLEDEDVILSSYIECQVDKQESFIETLEFIEDVEVDALYEGKQEDEYYLITAKRKESLNSQFSSDDKVYLHSQCGFNEGDEVKLCSSFGEAKFIVSLSDDVKSNSVLLFSGNKNGNYLTPYKSDEASSSAMFQEALVRIELS